MIVRNFNKAFWKWFRKSQVVDTDGDPLVVYHGSKSIPFTQFKVNHELGAHFAVDPQIAGDRDFAGDGLKHGRVYPCFLSLQKPYEAQRDLGTWGCASTWREHLYNWEWNGNGPLNPSEKEIDAIRTATDVRKFLLSRGYDGVVYENEIEQPMEGSVTCYIALWPTQIKSEFNDGTWGRFTTHIMNPYRR
jgi:hypothetical protein